MKYFEVVTTLLTLKSTTISDEETRLQFCLPCTQEAFANLIHKKNKDPEEVDLLAKIRKFLKHRKGLAES